MFNVTGGELVIIFLVALIVLGPERLPGAARSVGRIMSQIREVSNSFQKELKTAMDDAVEPVQGFSRPQLTAIEGGARTPDPTTPLVEPEPAPGWSTPPRPVLPLSGLEHDPGGDVPAAPLPADIAAAAAPPLDPAGAEPADDPDRTGDTGGTGAAASGA